MPGREKLLAASLLAADYGRLAEQGRAAIDAGADWLHIDVMDGMFVPNISLGHGVVRAMNPVREATGATLDVHLMIQEPVRYAEMFADAGADILTVHQEACVHLHHTLARIRELGMRSGVALNPATPIESLAEVIEELDLVLVMTVNPGFGGQKFISSMLDKVRRMREWIDNSGYKAVIEVDGGISASNIGDVYRAGVDVAVAGTAVFGAGGSIQQNVDALQR